MWPPSACISTYAQAMLQKNASSEASRSFLRALHYGPMYPKVRMSKPVTAIFRLQSSFPVELDRVSDYCKSVIYLFMNLHLNTREISRQSHNLKTDDHGIPQPDHHTHPQTPVPLHAERAGIHTQPRLLHSRFPVAPSAQQSLDPSSCMRHGMCKDECFRSVKALARFALFLTPLKMGAGRARKSLARQS